MGFILVQSKLIKNAKIYTANEEFELLDPGYIFINKSGKIESVGTMDDLHLNKFNETFKEIDLSGKIVCPGFVDAHTHLGICESLLTFEGDDSNEVGDPVCPQLRAIDAVNPQDVAFKEAVRAGVTTVLVSPGSANPIGGDILAMKTYGKIIDKMVIKTRVGIKFALGENPKGSYSERDESPMTRMATSALIREALYEAKWYYESKRKSATDDSGSPDYNIKNESMIDLLSGKTKAFFHAHRADDICTAVRIAKEFSLDYVLVHCTQGVVLQNFLNDEKANILLGPIFGDKCKPELDLLSSKTPHVLTKNNDLTICITTDHPETPIQYLLLSCKVAVEEGLSEENALKSITINPAKVCGIDDRVGSICKGKDADLNVFSRDLFKTMCLKPDIVFCSGEIIDFGEKNR